MLQALNLRCEYHDNPVGIDIRKPRLSWELWSDERRTFQTGYRILVAECKADLQSETGSWWDTGKRSSNSSFHIEYEGKKLKSFDECYWKVRVWDEHNRPSPWSETASWSMGIMGNALWQGSWISSSMPNQIRLPQFRKTFSVSLPVKKAVLFATARGLYHAFLNGYRIGREEFTPGWTDYNKRIHYHAYDVTNLLSNEKEQVLAAILADGWYRGQIGFQGQAQIYGNVTSLLMNLRIEYADGTVETIATDENWKWHGSPILESGILAGETYDARMELPGWNKPGFNASGRKGVKTYPLEVKPLYCWYPGNPTRKIREMKSRAIHEKPAGSFIFDLGQNIAGRVRLKIQGNTGKVVRLRHGEMLNSDGSLHIENLRSSRNTDEYICKGNEVEIWEPAFTYHGFRYVELSGLDKSPGLEAVTGIVYGADTPEAGNFHCSDELINQLYSNIVWTQRANYFEIPTDCPQRDERLGWTGDAQVFLKTAVFNMNVAAFFTKWMDDLLDAQFDDGAFPDVAPQGSFIRKADAAWGDAGIICPWILYHAYGDYRLLRKHYLSMQKWIAYLLKTSDHYIRRPINKLDCYGDWLAIDSETSIEIIMTAYFAWSVYLMADIAGILGETKDRLKYIQLFDEIRQAFRHDFIDKEGHVKGGTQTAYLVALQFNLIPDNLKEKAVSYLAADIIRRDYHFTVGFVGTALLLPALSQNGYIDIAYRLLQQQSCPSWLYPVLKGATTIWERWNSLKENGEFADPMMNSFSHCAFGCIGDWLFSVVCGINWEEPGFRRIRFAPRPGGNLRYAHAAYHSMVGIIKAGWEIEGKKITYRLTIPPNTQADVSLPVDTFQSVYLDEDSIQESPWINNLLIKNDIAAFTLGSGDYKITVSNVD
ncbi:MAG: family 78 glycoside hydrolase catalytic domain [Spirochaetota bacterium]